MLTLLCDDMTMPDTVPQVAVPPKDIDTVLEKSSKPLYELSSIFPFAFFPDTIRIYELEVHLIYRHFFFFRYDFPIVLKDLKNVTVFSGIFFSTMSFELAYHEMNPAPICVLKKSEARYARKLITGLSIFAKEGTNTASLPQNEVKDAALKIGK